jgi:molybdopterin/thiamine biosynthesis adenylyltransferase
MAYPTAVILDASVHQALSSGSDSAVALIVQDHGDGYVQETLIGKRDCRESIMCTVTLAKADEGNHTNGGALVLTQLRDRSNAHAAELWIDDKCRTCEVLFVDVSLDLHSRLVGLFETEALFEKSVLIIGLGSGGSPIAVELAKSGVGHFLLVDHDRLEIHNVVRHSCGLGDLGRFKTKAVRDLILEKSPGASVECYQNMVTLEWHDELESLINECHIVLCCTDNRESRLLVNSLALAAKKTVIYGGAFRRAYGGQVVVVCPEETFCYQCFIDLMPDQASNQEIASEEQAEAIAYADMPVAVEPGLSNDILPISQLCVKLTITQLLKGSSSTLKNLEEDLRSSWYLWLNRREVGTDYEELSPMDSDPEGMKILTWYGVEAEKNPSCPICGNFVSDLAAKHGFATETLNTGEFESE